MSTVLLADRVTPLPEMVSRTGVGLPTAITIPVLVAVLLQSTLAGSHPALELVSPRPLRALDTGLLAVGTAGALAAYVGSALVRENPLMFASARNVLGALGLALVCRRVLSPPTVSLVVVAYAAVSLMFGDRAHPQLWAFLLAAPGSPVGGRARRGPLRRGRGLGDREPRAASTAQGRAGGLAAGGGCGATSVPTGTMTG
jgi:hypothetical protein